VKLGYLSLLAAMVASIGLSAVPTSASTAAWSLQSTPSGSGQQNSVACWSLSGCLSVGGSGAMEWNGTTWTTVTEPSAYLAGVACPSAVYCIAVGNTSGEAAAWSWNGTTWTALQPYTPPGSSGFFFGIKCRSDTSCEAVGASETNQVDAPLAEFWNGTTWVNQTVTGAPGGSWLEGVACQSSGTCEAVGDYPSGVEECSGGVCIIPPTAWAAGLSGSTWVDQPSLSNLYQLSGALSVSCWSSGCTAVGYEGSGSCLGSTCYPSYTFAARWNGTTWSKQGAIGGGEPSGNMFADWNSVHCRSASSCTAVGVTGSTAAASHVPLISHWNGTKWSHEAAPGSGSLNSLSCVKSSSVCEAVGNQSDGAALAERN
jgi:hypothetical protein